MRFSYSKIKTYLGCKRAYFFRYVEGLKPVEENKSLFAGRIIHKMLDNAHAGLGILTGVDDTSPEQHEIIRQAEEVVTAYLGSGPLEIDKNEVELVSTLRIGSGVNVEFIGYVDGIMRDGTLVERKTVSSWKNEAEFLVELQSKIYCHFTGSRRVVYEQIKRKLTKPKLLKSGNLSRSLSSGMTYEGYVAAIDEHGLDRDEYKEMLDHLSDLHIYKRYDMEHTDSTIDIAMGYVKEAIKAILKEKWKSLPVPLFAELKCRSCQFSSLCEMEMTKRNSYRDAIGILYKHKEG